jgi:hypothetical protein
MNLFKTHNEYSDYTVRAQNELKGRTHYVDPDTLRYFRSRILYASAFQGGTLFGIVESVSLDPNHTKRGFMHMIFGVDGTTHTRPGLEECVSSKRKALADLHKAAGQLDGKALARAAATEHVARAKREARYLREQLKGLKS